MKILVPCKRVPDPDQKLRLNAEATDIDTAALTYILNPFDAIAVEEALRIRETAQPDAEIIAVSIAPGHKRLEDGEENTTILRHTTFLTDDVRINSYQCIFRECRKVIVGLVS